MKYRKEELEKELEEIVNQTKSIDEAVNAIISFFKEKPMKECELEIIEVKNKLDIHKIAWRLKTTGKLPSIEIYAMVMGQDKTPKMFFFGKKSS